jgi:hypothetical protein
MKRKTTMVKVSPILPSRKSSQGLLTELRELIVRTRQTVARGVNAELVRLYWQIGQRIRRHILQGKRAQYGQEIVAALSQQLTREFGRGFTTGNLSRMMALAEAFEEPILAALSQQLGWSHFVELLPLNKPMQRDFYVEMCRIEGWSIRTLRQKIQAMLYERTALSKKPAKLAATELKQLREDDKLTPNLVFRDPYLLDLGDYRPDQRQGPAIWLRCAIERVLPEMSLPERAELRWKPNRKWGNDRGKESKRDRTEYRWFWCCDEAGVDFMGGTEFDGNRWNNGHYSNNLKQTAREAGKESR